MECLELYLSINLKKFEMKFVLFFSKACDEVFGGFVIMWALWAFEIYAVKQQAALLMHLTRHLK